VQRKEYKVQDDDKRVNILPSLQMPPEFFESPAGGAEVHVYGKQALRSVSNGMLFLSACHDKAIPAPKIS